MKKVIFYIFIFFCFQSETICSDIKKEIDNADKAVTSVLSEVLQAFDKGTFAVGGCLVQNDTGELIISKHNNVIKKITDQSYFIYDPTAHGECQLIEWYYENKTKLKLLEPKDLTIITSLDPCIMCAGAILTAGFNVGIIAMDDSAGVNYKNNFLFDCLPKNLADIAKTKFAYYACRDELIDLRKYVGSQTVKFSSHIIKPQQLAICDARFKLGLNRVRNHIFECGRDPKNLLNPRDLPENSPIKTKFRSICEDAFQISIPDGLTNQILFNLLNKKAEKYDAENAGVLIDPFGNILLCFADNFQLNCVSSALMQLTSQYAKIRYELMNSENEEIRNQAENYLTHPKYGTFILLNELDAKKPTTLMDLGAYGSTMEGPLPENFPPNIKFLTSSSQNNFSDLIKLTSNLPPFYTHYVKISLG